MHLLHCRHHTAALLLQVLDIGSGSGYLTAIMANMVRDENCQGQAIGIEHIPELAERSQAAARQIPYANRMLQEGTLTFLEVRNLQWTTR